MRPLTDQEKRTIRFAGIGLTIYLTLFCGTKAWGWLEARRSEHSKLVAEAQALKLTLKPYESKIQIASKLMENFRMDPAKFAKKTLIAEASAAIQKAASSGGLKLGTIRESASGTSSKELGSLQLEAIGPVVGMMKFLQQFETLGFPLIIDTMQISPDPRGPGSVKLTATIIIMDFEQWKEKGVPHA